MTRTGQSCPRCMPRMFRSQVGQARKEVRTTLSASRLPGWRQQAANRRLPAALHRVVSLPLLLLQLPTRACAHVIHTPLPRR